MTSTSMPGGDEGDIVQQTAGGGSYENKEKVIFDPSTQDFREAVTWTGFVDKTLLIKELLSTSEPKCVIIVAPSRFGKSLNMDMVERFFEIEPSRLNKICKPPQDLEELEKYENYKAFKRYGQAPKCKILNKEELVKEHFGRHPVVHLDLRFVDTYSTQALQDSLRAVVRKAYHQHTYLNSGEIFSDPSDNEDANEYVKIWCDPRKYKEKDPIDGLQTLIKYLHNYHKRKVYFLVDEFDAPATEALLGGKSGDEVREISNQVTKLIGNIVEGTIANEYLLGSLITGVSSYAGVGTSDPLKNITVYKWLLNDRFAPYYGLQDYELTPLLEHVFPNEKKLQDSVLSEVNDLYNGYFFNGKSVYCLWSVLHYIDSRSEYEPSEIEEISFWRGLSFIKSMSWLLKDTKIMEQMIQLMSGGHVSFIPCDNVSAQELADFLQGRRCNEYIVYPFFMELGYLSHIPDQENENKSTNDNENKINEAENVYAKIPNLEVKFGYKRMFMTFCAYLGLSESVMISCREIFQDLRKNCNDPEKCKELIRVLCGNLKELLSGFQGKEGINESAIQAALFATMFTAGFKAYNGEKRIHSEDGNFGIVHLYMRGDYAIIFEVKYLRNGGETTKNSAHLALKEIVGENPSKKVPYTKILDEKEIKKSLLVGLCVSKKYEPSMCCLLNDRNIVNCFYIPEQN